MAPEANERPEVGGRPVDILDRLAEFDGATFVWDVLFQNYGGLRLEVRRAGEKIGEVQFTHPKYIDCACTMSQVRMRSATPEERSRLPDLPYNKTMFDPEVSCLALEADEGTFLIWAYWVIVRYRTEWVPASEEWKLRWPEPSPFVS